MRRDAAFRRAIIFAVAILTPAILLARAGGGEGYSGGVDISLDGGGGDGDGFAFVLYLLIQLAFRYPAIGVPLLIVVVAGYYVAQRQGIAVYKRRVIRRGGEAISAARLDEGLAALRSDDPQFRPEELLTRVSKAFTAIQEAWSRQDLSRVRAFVSDGVFERFNIQFGEQKDLRYRNDVSAVQVLGMEIAQASADDVFQSLSIRIRASARDVHVDAVGRRTQSSNSPFVEVWTFLRKRGVQSKLNAQGLIEGHCPNCGVGIEMNQHASCGQCGSLLRSGQYDWVLVEITQECEWAPEPPLIQGVTPMRRRDPGFSVAGLEDSASVIFWRLLAAERVGVADPIRKMASDAFCDREFGTTGPDGIRYFHAKAAVGSVRTLGLYEADGWDSAVVEVRWSAQRAGRTPSGEISYLGPNGASRMLLQLSRRSDVSATLEASICSAHCPGCGAPEEESAANACEHCGIVLNDGAHGWILTSAGAPLSIAGHDITASLQQGLSGATGAEPSPTPPWPGNAQAFAWLVLAAASDDEVSARERTALLATAGKWGIPPERVDEMLAAAKSGQLQLPEPSNSDELRQWLGEMARISLADGKLANGEFDLLLRAGAKGGLVRFDIKNLLNQARAQLYAESRVALRNRRRPKRT